MTDDYENVWENAIKIFPILTNSLKKVESSNQNDIDQLLIDLKKSHTTVLFYETVFQRLEQKLANDTVSKFWADICYPKIKEMEFFQVQMSIMELYQQYQIYTHYVQLLSMIKTSSTSYKRTLKSTDDIDSDVVMEDENGDDNDDDDDAEDTIDDLDSDTEFWLPNYIERCDMEYFNGVFKSTLFSQINEEFITHIESFYSSSFKVFLNCHKSMFDDNDDDSDDLDVKCGGCDLDIDRCRCQDLVDWFNDVNEKLSEMNILSLLCGTIIMGIAEKKITTKIQDLCSGVYNVLHYENLKLWVFIIPVNWLTRIYNYGSLTLTNDKIKKIVHQIELKLNNFLCMEYAKFIIDQFFNIIIDYPDSQPIINEFRTLLTREPSLRKTFVQSLISDISTRLLQTAVNTADILTAYIAIIKTLRYLDNSRKLLIQLITDPIRQYMSKRTDTVRCVVTALIEDAPSDLCDELLKYRAEPTTNTVKNWRAWEPEPLDDLPTITRSVKERASDIYSLVIDTYGSPEHFISEYRSLLSDRLLLQCNFDTEKELRHLELLKLRFGETLLHNCEVMLKDFSDSRRINVHIAEDPLYVKDNQFKLNTMILSSQFWPTFKSELLRLPLPIIQELERFTKAYEMYKGNRTLVWRPAIGNVVLSIELDDGRAMEVSVSPTIAAIIYKFSEKPEWYLDDLSTELHVPPTLLRKRLTFWINLKVIKEVHSGYYELNEYDETTVMDSNNSSSGDPIKDISRRSPGGETSRSSQKGKTTGTGTSAGTRTAGAAAAITTTTGTNNVGDVMVYTESASMLEEYDEDDNGMATTTTKTSSTSTGTGGSNKRHDEELQTLWTYIHGMLTNLYELPLARIYQMLKMFAPNGCEMITQDDLKNFLQRKVREHELIYSAGNYHLPTK